VNLQRVGKIAQNLLQFIYRKCVMGVGAYAPAETESREKYKERNVNIYIVFY
jgi:hypothetical protein